MLEFDWAGERLVVMAHRALFWPRTHSLFVADVHLGKSESFRAGSLPIPSGTTDETLGRLQRAIDESRASKLYILGDLWHARAGRTLRIEDRFRDWRCAQTGLEVFLVEGNHDLRSGGPISDCDLIELPDSHLLAPFTLRHYPDEVEGQTVLAGHLHPAVALTGRGGQGMRLPCFWFGDRVGVLPAFGDFTGNYTVRPRSGDQVFVVADGKVFSVG